MDADQVKRDIVAALEARRRRRAGEPPRPVKALALARRFQVRVGSTDDSRKKGVRNLVRELRAEGVPIVSDLRGYWIAEQPTDHTTYREFLRRAGLSHLAEAARDSRSTAAADAAGQLALFG
jgi:hypothetical protein